MPLSPAGPGAALPRSRAPQASRLRAAVSKKHLDFFDDYSDEVLAEYIVVLVCNGKNQNQARNDLEAFLGDESEKFVAWLWDYLSEDVFTSKALLCPSNDIASVASICDDDVNMKHEPETICGLSVEVFNIPLSFLPAEDPQSRSSMGTNADARRLSLTTRDPELQHISQSRGNVWDRLGKPCTREDTLLIENKSWHGLDACKRQKVEDSELQKPRLMWVVPGAKFCQSFLGESAALDGDCGKVVSNGHSEESMKQNRRVQSGTVNDAYNSKQKGQFLCIDSRDVCASFSMPKNNPSYDKKASQKLKKSSSVNYHVMQNLSEVTLEDKNPCMLSSGAKCHSVKSAVIDPNSQLNKIPQALLKRKAQVTASVENLVLISNSTSDESKSLDNIKGENASHRLLQDEVLDAKLRLHQIEREMLKLRSKQVEISNETKLNTSSGAQPDKDIDSRTIVVTNVHYGASKDALSSHFTKCGVVVRVVLLTDTMTGQPKGAAYIVFSSKESVDKAVIKWNRILVPNFDCDAKS